MEDNFYKNEFEIFLKDSADNFRMYPSKKVWHGLYNDLHPGRRWPSLAVCLLLVSSILYIGISNNNSINYSEGKLLAGHILDQADKNNILANRDLKIPLESINTKKSNHISDNNISGNINKDKNNSTYLMISKDIDASSYTSSLKRNQLLNTSTSEPVFNNDFIRDDVSGNVLQNSIIRAENDKIKTIKNTNSKLLQSESGAEPIENESNAIHNNDEKILTLTADNNIASKIELKQNAKPILGLANADNRTWMEDYAFHNKAKTRIFKNKAAIQFYITPSVGFRQLYKNNELTAANTNASASATSLVVTVPTTNLPLKDKITQSSAINIETGLILLYNISKRIRIKGGLQFNYTGYNVDAVQLSHPFQTNLLLNDPKTGVAYLSQQTSFYGNSASGNGDNNSKLKNNTLQLAIPIGADYKIAGNKNLRWYAGASVQPTYITGGYLFALSADEKNYIEDPSLLRKWNLNASVETFISYKTPSGLIISLGPQIRHQFLSTYDKRYTYTEKLYNFGVKLGLTTNF